jgi:hypothetical protein
VSVFYRRPHFRVIFALKHLKLFQRFEFPLTDTNSYSPQQKSRQIKSIWMYNFIHKIHTHTHTTTTTTTTNNNNKTCLFNTLKVKSNESRSLCFQLSLVLFLCPY